MTVRGHSHRPFHHLSHAGQPQCSDQLLGILYDTILGALLSAGPLLVSWCTHSAVYPADGPMSPVPSICSENGRQLPVPPHPRLPFHTLGCQHRDHQHLHSSRHLDFLRLCTGTPASAHSHIHRGVLPRGLGMENTLVHARRLHASLPAIECDFPYHRSALSLAETLSGDVCFVSRSACLDKRPLPVNLYRLGTVRSPCPFPSPFQPCLAPELRSLVHILRCVLPAPAHTLSAGMAFHLVFPFFSGKISGRQLAFAGSLLCCEPICTEQSPTFFALFPLLTARSTAFQGHTSLLCFRHENACRILLSRPAGSPRARQPGTAHRAPRFR